jgi:hypothetical protein
LEKKIAHKSGEIAIVCPSLGTLRDGISEYAKALSNRLKVPLYETSQELPDAIDTVIVETEKAVFKSVYAINFDERRRWFLDCHSINGNMISWLKKNGNVIPIIRSESLLRAEETKMTNNRYELVRSRLLRIVANVNSRLTERIVATVSMRYARSTTPKLANYVIAPHILYAQVRDSLTVPLDRDLCIGSFGFAFRFKNFDKIIQVSKRLRIKAIIMATVNNSTAKAFEETSAVAKELEESASNEISIITNYLGVEEILSRFRVCTHLIFAQEEKNQTSGSMRLLSQLGLPIIATDSLQAREAGCIRVKNTDEITREFLEATRSVKVKMDDGLPYYSAILR